MTQYFPILFVFLCATKRDSGRSRVHRATVIRSRCSCDHPDGTRSLSEKETFFQCLRQKLSAGSCKPVHVGSSTPLACRFIVWLDRFSVTKPSASVGRSKTAGQFPRPNEAGYSFAWIELRALREFKHHLHLHYDSTITGGRSVGVKAYLLLGDLTQILEPWPKHRLSPGHFIRVPLGRLMTSLR